ncbi:MAG: hypothetical protein C0444_00490 [Microbacterium sp.]|nr:hypothetical protein [Microbacterium sp.]MBA4346864.1 hypothetical protein [Microbacterium sp.]
MLPEPVIRAMLPGRYRYDAARVPRPPEPPAHRVRLYVAPVDWAGQGTRWARAAERHLHDVGAVTMAYRVGGEFGHPVDQAVPVGAYVTSRRWQKAQRDAVLTGFTHVLIEAERAPFGALFTETVADQVRELHERGIAVAMVCHGSDIRLPSRHAASHADSPFAPGLMSTTPALEREALANRRLLDELHLPTFVSTPDLLVDVPEAQWLPVVVDVEQWMPGPPVLERAVPVVVHAPSRSVMKGSDLIDPAMRALEAEGIIEYRRLLGVPADEMPSAIRSADIVLEQFRLGSYGVAACEALAAGRIVVGNVTEQVRDHVRAATGRELPVVQSTAADVAAVVRGLLADRQTAREQAVHGREFVLEVHDGRRSAAVLAPFLGTTTV